MIRFLSWIIRLCVGMVFFFVLVFSTNVRAKDEFIRLSDYLRDFPLQQTLIHYFSARVRSLATPLQITPSEPVRIAIIYPDIQTSDYWRRSKVAFEYRSRQVGMPYELKYYASRPAVDMELQGKQLAEALKWQPDYLIFTLDIAPHSTMIERTLAKAKAKIILQNSTTPLVRIDPFFTPDLTMPRVPSYWQMIC